MQIKLPAPRAELTLPNGETVEVERIGKGRYSTAWRNCHSVYLQTHGDDNGKEIMCTLSRVPRNKHIPDCKRLDWADGDQPYRWYKMPLYQLLTAKSGKAWEDYKLLHSIMEDAWRSLPYDKKGAYYMRDAFNEMVQDATYLSDDIKEAIQQLVDEAANYGDYSIEIVKRNCAVDGDGNLILLDPVFDLEAVRRKRGRVR